MITILTLNYNDYYTTIEFIRNHIHYDVVEKIVVVDNSSTDNSYDKLSELSNDKIIVLKTEYNMGYGPGNNFGLRWIKDNLDTKYVLLSNPDVIISENTILTLENFISKKKDAVIVAPFMLNSKGIKMYNTAFKIPSLSEYIFTIGLIGSKYFNYIYYKSITEVTSPFKKVGAVSGSCFMLNLNKFLSFGGFDENVFLYCEEIIIGIKARDASMEIYLLPNETFIHNHSVSITKTYNSVVKRQKLLYKSKLYVIKKYLKASRFTYLLAKLNVRVALFEYFFKEKFFD